MSRQAWEKALTARGQGVLGGKRHKYGAERTTTPDGVTHDSKGESRRWAVLQQAQQVGLIKNLQRQVRFDLVVNGVKVCAYVADFTYDLAGDLAKEAGGAHAIVEDFKGTVTDVARIKMRLFEAVKGFPVYVTKQPKAAIGGLKTQW